VTDLMNNVQIAASPPALASHIVQNQVRAVGINPNHWYAVAEARAVKAEKILPVTIWEQDIALFRDSQGQIQAVEDACPHKGVAISKGQVKGDAIVCGYHGWEFSGQGDCLAIPYFPPGQKLPRACMRSFPVREQYGLIWLFPGDATRAEATPMLDIPQFGDPDWLMIPLTAQFKAHFSICNENTMDVFHGYLHQNLQGWFDPQLLKLQDSDTHVAADYQVSYQGFLTKLLGLSDSGSAVTTQVISIDYQYPHYVTTLQGVSYLYLMRLPIGPHASRSFALFFLPVRIPRWLLNPLRPLLEPLVRDLLFMRFLRQDIEMIESEAEQYRKRPDRRYVEVNPAIIAVQRLIQRQHQIYLDETDGGARILGLDDESARGVGAGVSG
jgi:renierapurpurin 18,18'-hydroxylase